MHSNAPEWNAPDPSFLKNSINKNVGRQYKSSVNIYGAARWPHSSNSSSNVENNCHFKHFNSDNNFKSLGLTYVQGKLELLDVLDSKSNFSSSVPARHHVFTTWLMAWILPLGWFLKRNSNGNLKNG